MYIFLIYIIKLKERLCFFYETEKKSKPAPSMIDATRQRSSINEPSLTTSPIISYEATIAYLRFSVSFGPGTEAYRGTIEPFSPSNSLFEQSFLHPPPLSWNRGISIVFSRPPFSTTAPETGAATIRPETEITRSWEGQNILLRGLLGASL